MALAEPMPGSDGPLRCAYCGGVIGVYEPVTQVVGELAWKTSRAAEPSLSPASPGALYHGVCYDLARRGDEADPRGDEPPSRGSAG